MPAVSMQPARAPERVPAPSLPPPQSIAALPRLTRLELSEHTFGDPTASLQALGRLTTLHMLDLTDAALTALPPQLSALSRLTELNLPQNERMAQLLTMDELLELLEHLPGQPATRHLIRPCPALCMRRARCPAALDATSIARPAAVPVP